MDDLFGVSMDLIMWVLLALLAVAAASVAFVALRNRIMFKMGIRNIPRRRAQTILIVLGLMLSTVIISAAFTTGDTVDRSITSQVYTVLGSVDEVIHVGSDDDGSFDDPNQGTARENSFPADSVAPLVQMLEADPEVDAVIPAYQAVAVAVNPEARLSSPLFNVLGLDPAKMRNIPDIRGLDGTRYSLDELGPGEIFLDESAAEELDVEAGDTIVVYALGRENRFRIKAVVEDKRLAGAGGISVRREGGVVPLEVARQLFDAPGQLTMLVVSNQGDARAGVAHADSVESKIEAALQSLPRDPTTPALAVAPVKRTGVEIAEIGANIFTTFFLVLGLFSIGAGVLLIFMIFVMLAAERKPEMGMARAVGTKRMDLVQTFLAEGMAYNLLAAMVGTALGVVVSFVMTRIMAAIFAEFDIEIAAHVTFRSLAIAYSLGVVLTFFTVTFSSWRVSYINIVRAIRDIPEPPPARPMWGRRSFWAVLRDLFFRPASRGGWLRRGAVLVALILAGIGSGGAWPLLALAGLIVVAVFASFAWSQQALPWLFKLGVFLGELIAFPISLAAGFFMTFQLGPLFVIGSIPLLLLGMAEDNAFALLFGLSLLPLGLALVVRSFGANERLTYTLTGLFLIYVWEIDFSVGLIERIFGEAEGDIEMFFLSGVMVTIAATFLIVYNSDIVLGPLTRMG
ncbi:MAG TPA: ABC transporter permease, partial [Dehalococcoidia bacterium]|nr:ABC transporter permease [Dehalococcoidia bacterium]